MDNSEDRFAYLLQIAVDKRNGNRIRHLVRIVAHAYSQNPKKLKNYFNNENQLVAGIATSAYHFLTGKITPIQKKEFGGLGAIINQSKENLKFNKKQLWFAKISGNSLRYSENSEDSLWNSENSGFSLLGSENSGFSLWNSENSGFSLFSSKNSDYSLWYSENSGDSLRDSDNSGFSLRKSKNSGDSLRYSENSDGSLQDSESS